MRSPLEQLFIERDEAYIQRTHKIMHEMHNTLAAIAQLVELDPSKGVISWEEISLIGDSVLMIGIIEYEPGAIIKTLNGETLEITNENARTFSRLIKIGLPVSLVVNGNTEEIYAFLKQSVQVDEDGIPPEMFDGQHSTDFNLDDLTEEQKEALRLHLKGTPNNTLIS